MRKRSSWNVLAVCLTSIFVLASSAAEPPDPLRLGGNVVPSFQSIRLEVDADTEGYSGSVHIDIEVYETTSSFRFHAKGMKLENLRVEQHGKAIEATHTVDDHGLVTVETSEPLSAGPGGLDVAFSKEFNRQAAGLYKVESNGQGYSFTQFEAEYAREAFPCWDEPIFKIPFQMTLVVPEDHRAISNTPVRETSVEDGWKTVVFERTRPMPSYLLAVATGPFEAVPVEGMSIPGNIITVQGKSHLAAEAVAITPPVLAALEEYFDSPYPYRKLDVIAVPEFLFGAMENVGAVTFRDDLLLMDPRSSSIGQKRTVAVIMAHELAHMWFGNLVTLEWWDDAWLNEAFATWMGYKATDVAFPEYRFTVEDVESRQGAMRTDALPSARPIRHGFRAGGEPMEMFDELTYQKGQAVLSMIEQWLGEETFRRGMIDYMERHKWKNASADDLWNALSEAADRDVGATMETFISQPGIPVVDVDLMQENLIRLSQHRYENYGQNSASGELWQIPVTLRYSDGEETYSQDVLLTREEQTVELQTGNPVVWIHPNGNEKGYYRWGAPAHMLSEMASRAPETLSLRERIGFVDNVSALFDAGSLGGADYLGLIGHFAEDPSPEVSAAVVDAVDKIHEEFVTDDLKGPFANYVRQILSPILDRIGIEKDPGEDQATSRLRSRLILMLGGVGRDERIKAHALDLAESYDRDRSSIDPALVQTVLVLAARDGGTERFEQFKARFDKAMDPAQRRRYLVALGNFRDHEIAMSVLEFSLSETVRPNEKGWLPGIVAKRYPEDVFEWTTANYDRLSEEVPKLHLSFMMPAIVDGRSEALVERAEAFLSDASRTSPMMKKNLRKVADRVNRRARLIEKEGSAVTAYLTDFSKRG